MILSKNNKSIKTTIKNINVMDLKQTFIKTLSQYLENIQILETLWQEIKRTT
ncbi:conserved hypothetical protein [Leptospira interrogans serovar Manilae]|uniref:Uncharacterized protein n=2 Tax=Leptospira interrogans TaxID=173 RepID=A0AAQ1NVK6_LEPIR|nr:hypothetical protein LEP1GSC067_3782 [Leptospira interrogans serovar Lora str. TE 1992]EMJ47379.1 hypothetical protein LEP1GSC111_2645 [Leptospira interrogans str. UT126]SOR60815.1 conserved hypothetical protein [Leptospira interrogans serovar Manilae]